MAAPGLSARLKALVRVVEATLGQVVAEAEGRALFESIEDVRRAMVDFRQASDRRAQGRALGKARRRLRGLGSRERGALARAYTVYLELINVCENAYRTHRLRERPRQGGPDGAGARVIYVLTAHPTESRSPENIRLLRRIQDLLVAALDQEQDPDPEQLRHLLHLVWRVGTHPPHKPSVIDEASHLFSLLSDPILSELIDLARRDHKVFFRTWVGGDKDGHPGVGPRQTAASLQLSRDRLLGFVRARLLERLREDVALLDDEPLRRELGSLRAALADLERVDTGDGGRVRELRRAAARFQQVYRRGLRGPHPLLEQLDALLELFPGLVVPLELREERGLFGLDQPIASMLRFLVAVGQGGELPWYVRGLVVSMASAPQDLLEALQLIEDVAGRPDLPVIPLFELPEVLERAVEILDQTWASAGFRESVRRHDGQLEVMLGYSDTSKRMGVLASRLSIGETMHAVGDWAREAGVQVTFFHGSGGSVGRGGGTLEDRAATWPRDQLVPLKETLQGEMVERTLATPEILRGNVLKVAGIQAQPPRYVPPSRLIRRLGEASQQVFQEVVGSPELRALLAAATPYEHLGALTIGSRPVRRKKKKRQRKQGAPPAGLESLRAIPWVLCWTQTRYLLHAWLGIGSAWRQLREEPGAEASLRRELKRDPLLRSYLRLLGFTLAKTEPRVWEEYVKALGPDVAPGLVKRLERERQDALDLARRAGPGDELLPDRPWLLESIYYRAPMIHPLNLLQLDVLARARQGRLRQAEQLLFRETVTGVAAGMLTTG